MRILSFILAAALALGFMGCKKEPPPEEKKPAPVAQPGIQPTASGLPRPTDVGAEVQNSIDRGAERAKQKLNEAR